MESKGEDGFKVHFLYLKKLQENVMGRSEYASESVQLGTDPFCTFGKTCKRGLSPIARFLVPRAGVEPARVAPLVFETSASTDSAIWAGKNRREGTTFC